MDICRVKKREKVAYGMGDLGNNIAYGAVGFYFVFFLTDVAGLSPLWAGNIFMIILPTKKIMKKAAKRAIINSTLVVELLLIISPVIWV